MTLDEISRQVPELIRDIRKSDRKSSLAALGALLMQPDVQSNALRIEGLVHLVDVYANGRGKPTTSTVSSWFAKFGSYIGPLEDPAEDVFAGYVGTSVGGFRVLEGLWEGSCFYTEIVLRAVERIPAADIKYQVLAPSYALLKLSDLLADRANVERYQMGNDLKHDQLPSKIAGSIYGNRNKVRLTNEELAAAGIDKSLLSPFLRSERISSDTNFLEDSLLHRQPLLELDDGLVCVLPSAIGMAIRLFVISTLDAWGLLDRFQQVLCAVYAEFFKDQHLIDRPRNVPIGPVERGIFSGGFVKEFDTGRYLHFLPIIPSMNGIAEGGMLSVPTINNRLGEYLDERCNSACEIASKHDGFVEIIHLICIGGVGEGVNTRLTAQNIEQSRVVTLPAHDLRTLSDLQGL